MTQEQRQLAEDVRGYLIGHLCERLTIPELASRFLTSPTNLKKVFRQAYGVPVYAFVRRQKMQIAADRLIEGDATVTAIASDLGYRNSSKFARAFADVMGMSPTVYRRTKGGKE